MTYPTCAQECCAMPVATAGDYCTIHEPWVPGKSCTDVELASYVHELAELLRPGCATLNGATVVGKRLTFTAHDPGDTGTPWTLHAEGGPTVTGRLATRPEFDGDTRWVISDFVDADLAIPGPPITESADTLAAEGVITRWEPYPERLHWDGKRTKCADGSIVLHLPDGSFIAANEHRSHLGVFVMGVQWTHWTGPFNPSHESKSQNTFTAYRHDPNDFPADVRKIAARQIDPRWIVNPDLVCEHWPHRRPYSIPPVTEWPERAVTTANKERREPAQLDLFGALA